MGYNTSVREETVKNIFEAKNSKVFTQARKKGIHYIIIPKTNIVDFNYSVDRSFFHKTLKIVYEDNAVTVFKL
jgi:uncharacterized membrane protein